MYTDQGAVGDCSLFFIQIYYLFSLNSFQTLERLYIRYGTKKLIKAIINLANENFQTAITSNRNDSC